MIAVPPGRVTLSHRGRGWSVDLAPYEFATHPVPQARYAEVTGERPSTAHGDLLPVEGVSWFDAVRFCNALSGSEGLTPAYRVEGDDVEWDESADGYRLPTEAEWEHACRAGTTGARYGPLDDIGWYRGNFDERIHEVGGKRPNAWGLHDMLGNVWESCTTSRSRASTGCCAAAAGSTSTGAAAPPSAAAATPSSGSTTSASASPAPPHADADHRRPPPPGDDRPNRGWPVTQVLVAIRRT